MENMMKRAISAFMALVLVLGMVPGIPMFAGAEEVETQPETVAVETTEAVTVPEDAEAPETTVAAETEAPETVPETTAEAETVPEETVPETTVEAETVPEETVTEETIPEETAGEETVPEETEIPEVSEEAADANDTIVLAKKIEISASKERTYVGDDVKLTATFTPADTTETEVSWVVEGGSVNATALEKGYLRATEAGIFTVHAEAIDGSGIISDPIEVEFVNYKMEINEAPIPEENVYEGQYVLQTGDSMPISVKYMTWGGDESEDDAKVELPMHTPSVKWSMAIVDPNNDYATTGEDVTQYISWTEAADTKEIQLKAKLVTEYKYILVTAKEMINNVVLGESSILIRLYPDSYKLYITDENGNDVTNKTIVLDMANEETQMSQTLTAKIWPVEGDEDLVWSCSDTLVELEDLDGKEETANKAMRFTANPRAGETVISVQGAEHPGVYATVTIKRVRLIQAIEPSKATAEIEELVEGKSVTLVAIDSADREILNNSLLKWELAEGDEAYATISDKGVLKAKNVDMGRVITVRCSVIDNEDNAYFELYIPIRPKATSVKLLAGSFAEDDSAAEEVINGKTITVDTVDYTPRCLDFIVEHYAEEPSAAGDPVGAVQEVTWKSSNTAVAAFDPLTDELVWKGKNGTVTITATAKDGSGKSASVKLTFGAKLRELSFNDQEGMFLRSGSSWTFDLSYYPENASNKSVTWSLAPGGEAYASISSSGRLTAKTVYDNHMVTVIATSKENPNIQAAFDVLIRPKKDYSLTLMDGDTCVTKTTIMLDVDESISLSAVLVGEELGEYFEPSVTWKSSSKSVEVDEGYITALKTGTATITATDDSKQTATVTIKVVSKVDEVEVYEKNDIHVLASGKSLSLKVNVYDYDSANGKPSVSKVNWVIEEGGEQYATVNSSGKVTAVKDYDGEPVTISVYAVSTDGSDVWSNPYEITISPAVEGMRIDMEDQAQTTGSYTHYLRYPGEESVQLLAVTYPEYACDDVTWTTSSKTIATVDEDGLVTFLKAGTVTITAAAQDGSGKKATFKIKIVQTAMGMGLDNEKNMVYDESRGEWIYAIAGGKNLTLKPVFYGIDGKKMSVSVEWEIDKIYDDYGTAFVKKFSKGTITTEKVTEPKFTTVTIKVPGVYVGWIDADEVETAVDQDGYIHFLVTVGVYPATTSLQITENGRVITSTSLWRKVGCEPFQLGVETNAGAAPGWEWKSSNEKIAWVDPYTGEVYSTGKAGTVTITATAKDGTGKKDSIKIQFAN